MEQQIIVTRGRSPGPLDSMDVVDDKLVPMVSPRAEVTIDVVDSVSEAAAALNKFEKTYEYYGMDTKMHRFPAGLGGMGMSYPYIVPRLVAIGPYHHGREHLQTMEEVKQAAVCLFAQRTPGVDAMYMREAFGRLVKEEDLRGRYIEDAATEGMEDDEFVDMMFRDACFLLLYMDAFCRSMGDQDDFLANQSLRRFFFANRDSIDNDIMLLENQLPWPVIQALLQLVSPPPDNNNPTCPWLEVVSHYIVAVGNTFRVCEPSEFDKEAFHHLQLQIKDKDNPPPHLLALLRRHKIKDKENPNESSAKSPKERQPQTQSPAKPPKHTSISAITPMELEEIGVKLTPSGTDAFSDMDFVRGHLFRLHLRELSLAPLSLSDTRASCLVNMAAWEVCTASKFKEDTNKTAVCSYLALLAMFMVREDDVHNLRSQGLLHGNQSNMEMLTFFKTLMKHLPDSGSRFAHIMLQIARYKNNSYRATLYKLVYNNLLTIIKVLSIIATLIGVYQAILSLSKKK